MTHFTTLQLILSVAVHILLPLLLAPLFPGIINKVKAAMAGRRGPPLRQPYLDIIKLLRKTLVISNTTTWIFVAGPLVAVGAMLATELLIPIGPSPAPIHFAGDVILFVYLFAAARFFTTSAALDTGSSFEGMGAAREVSFAVVSEAALIFSMLIMMRFSGGLSLNTILLEPFKHGSAGPRLMAAAGLFVFLLAETSRVPIDDPDTHLELTMIHEVMVLDHSGPLLAAVQYASALRLLILINLVLLFVSPLHTGIPVLSWVLFILEASAAAVLVGVIESVMARLPLRHVPTLLAAAAVLSGLGFVLALR
ncbi:MAG: respiratory chain complex I subunit 1 family protein [Phycisphaerae bacterium]